MKRETIVWLALFLLGGGFLLARAVMSDHGMGREYVVANVQGATEDADAADSADTGSADGESAETADAEPGATWTIWEQSNFAEYTAYEALPADQKAAAPEVRFDLPRTIGLWVAAFFTLSIFSFLYKDNALYKIAEACVVGVSAAYWMVLGFHSTIMPNLIAKLLPDLARSTAMPGLSEGAEADFWYLIPTFLGVLLIWRLAPKGAWIARWPMAFIIGTFCGLRLVTFLHSDFLSQIRSSIVPLVVMDSGGSFAFWDSMKNVMLVVGVLTCLVYFFFSVEHRGAVGKTARVGIWFLMVTFGAAFGYTVMGRIALLAARLEFLFDDWLWLIDPKGRHTIGLVLGLFGIHL